MYPFIALLWDPTEADASAAAQRLTATIREALLNYRPALVADGFAVLTDSPAGNSMRLYQLQEQAGVVLGRLFPMDMDHCHANWSWSPSISDTAEIVRSQGQWLIRNMWGSYIALIRNSRSLESFVIRDCSGKLPCYRLKHSRVDVIFSDPADLQAIGLISKSLNWRYIQAFLYASQVQIRDTALQSVTELLAGDCFHRSSATVYSQHSAWSPHSVFAQPCIRDFDYAVDQVRSVTLGCIGAWASTYDRILHSLSGGLDSTVVLACLSRSQRPPHVVCINTFGARSAEDERSFARLAASSANVELQEIPIISERLVIDDALTDLPLTAKPSIPGTIGTLGVAALNELGQRFAAESIWTGQGGDHLFLQTLLPLAPLDYVHLHGYRPAVLKSLRDAARLSGLGYWRALSLLWNGPFEHIAHTVDTSHAARHPFLAPDLRSCPPGEYLAHPWWKAPSQSLPPGRRMQVTALSEVLNRHRPLPRLQTTYEHHPLLSQPLLELCLRIPSYLHLHGGIDRAVERSAFANLIPDRIASRRQKGQSTFSILDTLHRSDGYIRDLLLGGVLSHEGIIDRAALAPYLEGHRPLELQILFPFLSCIAAELWIRNSLNHLSAIRPPAALSGHRPRS
ncbi:MAG: asparagine synthase [Proteobacteria bacterium]|nr:asparagine synthase [Pseudomonadota bacterium]